MDNNTFVNRLIEETESKEIKWQEIDDPFKTHREYQVEGKNGTQVVARQVNVEQYEEDGVSHITQRFILEIQDELGIDLGYIYENDLFEPSDMRKLYRLAQQNANKVDERMDGFFG